MRKLFIMFLFSITIFSGNDIDIQRFKPSLNTNGMIMTDTTDTLDKYKFSGLIYLHYDKAPFVFHKTDGSVNNIINNVFYGDIVLTFGVLKKLELGADLPFSLYSSGESPDPKKTLNTFSLGDIRIGARYAVIQNKLISFAMALNTYFPTGGNFNTSGGFNLQPVLITDLRLNKSYLMAFNFGYMFKSNDYSGLNTKMGDEIFYRWGNKFNASKNLDLLLELFGAFQVSKPFDKKEETPLELLLAANYFLSNIKLTGGGDVGLVSGIGTPLYRIILGIGYVSHSKNKSDNNDYDKDGILNKYDKCPQKPEDEDGFKDEDGCPDLDNDGDGILDIHDKCINKAEDIDGFKDKDGCPDLDNDLDGIKDNKDKCPNNPEDMDSFEDEDGCPDLDNDLDGIKDKEDKCPYDPEDKDNFEDEDGCPDLDNDEDGIKDIDDKCPNKPEVYNGNKDEDGCPDKGKTLVKINLKTNKLMILKKVYFKTASAKILKKSYPLLDVVVTTLKNNPDIKVVVEGHTDDRGSAEYNKKLSQRRAESVMKYLIKKGISEDRLFAKGYGEEKPIASNKTKEGREKNRRVEFTIIK